MNRLILLSFTVLAIFIVGCKKNIAINYNILFVDDKDTNIYLLNVNEKTTTIFIPSFKRSWNPVVSPDKEKVAFTALDSLGISQIYFYNILNGNLSRVTNFTNPFIVLDGYFTPDYSWSNDSRKIVYKCPPGLFIYYIDSLRTASIPPPPVEVGASLFGVPLWSPNADKIAVTNLFDILIYDVQNNKWFNITERNMEITGQIAWSPDGIYILYTQNDTTFIRDVDKKSTKSIFSGRAITDIKWSRGGTKIFYIYYPSENTSNLYSFDLSNERHDQLTFNNSFDGRYTLVNDSIIIYESKKDQEWKLYALNIYTKENREIIGKPYNARSPVIVQRGK